MKALPKSLRLTKSSYWLDGGSITLKGIDENGAEHEIHLVQRAFDWSPDMGRLYFDRERVEVRSETESSIVQLMQQATLEVDAAAKPIGSSNRGLILGDDIKQFYDNTPPENLRRFRDEIVTWVSSEEYVLLTEGKK